MRFAAVLFLTTLPLAAQVKITQSPESITVDIDGKPFTAFYAGATSTKPYLHPLRSASGKTVSRMYPMEVIAGESKDHPHHRGLWFTHGGVSGVNFWENEKAQKGNSGLIVLKKINDVKSGKKMGVIASTHEWQSPAGKPMLTETRVMTFSGDDASRTIDFDATLTAVGAPAKFEDTKEGFFAIRMATPLEEGKHTGRMTASTGASGEKAVWGKQAAWVDYAGTLDGEKLGIAIMDHPSNPKHPTFWHARAYGLFAANPFGEHDFFNDKTRDGSVTIEPGKSLRFRYRVVVHTGDDKDAGLAKIWESYSKTK